MDMDLYNDTYDRFCELIHTRNAEILEIACGPGNITRYLLKKRPDFRITGIDLSSKMIELAKTNVPSAEFILMDCREIGKLDKKYDAIMCGFCMPYLSNEECAGLISDMHHLLKPGGVVYFSTMEGEDHKSGFETTSFSGNDHLYIHYHQSGFLKKELEKNGFISIELQCKDYPEPDGSFTTDLIFVARKPA